VFGNSPPQSRQWSPFLLWRDDIEMNVRHSIIRNLCHTAPQLWTIWLFLVIANVTTVSIACRRQSGGDSLESAFTSRKVIELRASLNPTSKTVAALPLETPVTILARQRSFLKVRTERGAEGWIHKSQVVTSALRALMQQLHEQTKHYTAQGRVHAFQALNVHLEPHRWSPTLYQLATDEGVEVLQRKLQERLPYEPQPPIPQPNPTGVDDWYLVRTASSQPGWVLATGVYSGIPDEVQQHAAGHRIVAYLSLGEIKANSGAQKTTWIWAQAEQVKRTHDFSLVRIFQWHRKMNRYQTLRFERELKGYLPVRFIPEVSSKRGKGPGFSFTIERNRKKLRRTYLLLKSRVYLIKQDPAKQLFTPIVLKKKEVTPLGEPPSLTTRLLRQWSKFFE